MKTWFLKKSHVIWISVFFLIDIEFDFKKYFEHYFKSRKLSNIYHDINIYYTYHLSIKYQWWYQIIELLCEHLYFFSSRSEINWTELTIFLMKLLLNFINVFAWLSPRPSFNLAKKHLLLPWIIWRLILDMVKDWGRRQLKTKTTFKRTCPLSSCPSTP